MVKKKDPIEKVKEIMESGLEPITYNPREHRGDHENALVRFKQQCYKAERKQRESLEKYAPYFYRGCKNFEERAELFSRLPDMPTDLKRILAERTVKTKDPLGVVKGKSFSADIQSIDNLFAKFSDTQDIIEYCIMKDFTNRYKDPSKYSLEDLTTAQLCAMLPAYTRVWSSQKYDGKNTRLAHDSVNLLFKKYCEVSRQEHGAVIFDDLMELLKAGKRCDIEDDDNIGDAINPEYVTWSSPLTDLCWNYYSRGNWAVKAGKGVIFKDEIKGGSSLDKEIYKKKEYLRVYC
jgi:hypothetical protein